MLRRLQLVDQVKEQEEENRRRGVGRGGARSGGGQNGRGGGGGGGRGAFRLSSAHDVPIQRRWSETCEGRAADSLYRSSSVPSFYARPHFSRAYHARYDTSSVLQHSREMDRTRRTSGTRRPRRRRPGARRAPRRQDRPVVPLLSQDRSVRRDRSDGEGWTGRVLEWPAQIPCTCGQ